MKILQKIEWVLVDLDGTLVDSIEYLFQAYLNFLKDFEIKGTKKEFNSLNGPNLNQIIEILKKDHKIKGTEKILFQKYLKKLKLVYKNEIKLFPDSLEFLNYLINKKIKIGLVTSSKLELVNIFLEKNNLEQFFDIIISGDLVKNSKPDSEIYEKCLKEIQVNKKQIVVIEDSINGITSASNAGLKCLTRNSNLNILNELRKFLKINSLKL